MKSTPQIITSGQLSLRPGYPSEWTISRWRRDNIGPVYQRIGGRVFYAVADVEAWEQSRRGGGDEMPSQKKRGRKPKGYAPAVAGDNPDLDSPPAAVDGEAAG